MRISLLAGTARTGTRSSIATGAPRPARSTWWRARLTWWCSARSRREPAIASARRSPRSVGPNSAASDCSRSSGWRRTIAMVRSDSMWPRSPASRSRSSKPRSKPVSGPSRLCSPAVSRLVLGFKRWSFVIDELAPALAPAGRSSRRPAVCSEAFSEPGRWAVASMAVFA